jgi:hypothetical protein
MLSKPTIIALPPFIDFINPKFSTRGVTCVSVLFTRPNPPSDHQQLLFYSCKQHRRHIATSTLQTPTLPQVPCISKLHSSLGQLQALSLRSLSPARALSQSQSLSCRQRQQHLHGKQPRSFRAAGCIYTTSSIWTLAIQQRYLCVNNSICDFK